MLFGTQVYQHSGSIHIYKSLRDEVNTEYIIDDAYKRGKNIYFPTPDPYENTATSIIIVPGRKFDRDMTRYGRGGGYYDRFLENSYAIKIGICYTTQMCNTLVRQKWDVPMDMIVTENEVIMSGVTFTR